MISGAVVRDGRLELPTSCSQSKRATNCANPGFLVIQFCSRCGQTCGQAFFLTISACGGSACIAGVSRNCGHSIFRLEVGATRSQTRRDTNFAIPGYSLFCHDTTANGKNKVFSVCGHSCGQSRFCAVFGNRGKSSKRRCRKALRRFASPYPGYRHGTPKAGALPAALHPDMYFSARQHAFAHILRTFKKVAALPAAPALCDSAQRRRALSDCTGGKPAHFAICVR